ncbi:MAG: hypothetical protein IJN77_07545 [Oscillospiraceae bacterium]|nr:hypothetical protein [Oscillospiraceae bacterium]
MKKRIIALIATIIIAVPIFTTTAYRAQPRWSLINSATALCIIEDDYYIASVIAVEDVYKMDINVKLYEKGLFTSYTEVSSISKTVYNYVHTANKTYDFSSLKDYKVELTVKAYTQSGQTETVTISEEYT